LEAENVDATISIETLELIAKVLDVDISELLKEI
jgi:transcriptional regulator with XRE-family HTH domain